MISITSPSLRAFVPWCLRASLAIPLLALLAAAPLPPDAPADSILDALHDRGTDLKNFTADVTLKEIDNDLGTSTSRLGKITYELKSPGDARIHVIFDRKQEENATPKNEKIEYVLDNGWLIDRNYQRKTETRRQVLKPGEKINLLKLGEGPFPLPIGQDKADVYKQFEVSQPKVENGPNLPHVTLTPKPGTHLAQKFATIDVWVDPQTNMPTRISTLDANKSTTRETELKNIRINIPESEVNADFALPKIDETTWTLHEEPYSD